MKEIKTKVESEIPNQEQVWDEIAPNWKEVRQVPIKEAVDFLKDAEGNILDLGCGSGRNFVKSKGTIYGVDFSKRMLTYAKLNAKKKDIKAILIKTEGHKLPFEDNFFDRAIFIATLHCITSKEKREQALRELLRVMKPKSRALITVWNKAQPKFKEEKKEVLRGWSFNGERFERYYYLYDKKELVSLVNKVGFKIIKVVDKEIQESPTFKGNILVYVEKS